MAAASVVIMAMMAAKHERDKRSREQGDNRRAMLRLGLDANRTIGDQLQREEMEALHYYMSGMMLDPREAGWKLPIYRALKAHSPHMPGKIGVEISGTWDCLRSKMALDVGAARRMYVIVPIPRRAEECRNEAKAHVDYADRIVIVEGYSTEVSLPKKK